MKHQKITFFLTALVSMIAGNVFAYDFEQKNSDGVIIYYTITDSYNRYLAVSCHSTNKYTGNVAIPYFVDHNGNTYFVRSIEQKAFYQCTGLTSVTIPEGVEEIGVNAFAWCSNLYSITIPEGVKNIDNYAFYLCSGLTSIAIPSGCSSLGASAFEQCRSITTVSLPTSLKTIGSSAFRHCSSLSAVNNTSYLKTIESYAFADCPNLITISLGSVTSIGNYAFNGCSSLTSITFSSNLTSIGQNAFQNCSGLTSLTIPKNVTSIGAWAFRGCTGLSSIIVDSENTKYDSRNNCNAIIDKTDPQVILGCKNTIIPSGVKTIGGSAFFGCTELTSISIPSSITSIQDGAFEGCTGLTTISIPYNVYTIGVTAFRGCSSLETISVSSANSRYDSRNNCNAIIEKNSNVLITGCKNTIIPNDVVSIGTYAFTNNSSLTSITIPQSITSIGYDAFKGCNSLTTVVVKNETPIIGAGSSFSNRENATLYVPGGCKAAYQAADGWKDFKFIEETGIDISSSEIYIAPISAVSYSSYAHTPTVTVIDGTTTLTNGTDYTISYSNNTNAGTATVTITGKGNYKGTRTANFTINKVALTITAMSYTINQGDPLPTFNCSYNGFVGSEYATVLITQPTFSCSATSTSAPGIYDIAVSGADAQNYTMTYVKGILTILEKEKVGQTLELTAIPTMTYGDAAYTLPTTTEDGLTLTWSVDDTNIATVSTNVLTIANAGTTTVTANQAGNENYEPFSREFTLTVNKAPLTITANSYTINQHDEMPILDVTYAGFVYEELDGVLTIPPTVACSATNTETPGNYDIVLSGAEAQNYNITYVNGMLTITALESEGDRDSEGFKYINDFTYIKDLSDYTGTYSNCSFVNCTQHEDGNIIKANVFCVEKFYGRGEGQSYAHFRMYRDKNANDKIGEFDFCWGWYSFNFDNDDDFHFVDVYDNMEVGTSKQFNSDGIIYTLTLLDKIISDSNDEKKIIFSFDRPIYFGGDNNGNVGIERFSNRVQIKYLKDLNQNEELPLEEFTLPEMTYGGKAFRLPTKNSEEQALTWSVSNTDIASVSSNILTINGTGTTTLTATYGGEDGFELTSRDFELIVNKAPLTVIAKSYTVKQGNQLPTFECTYKGFVYGETESVLTTLPTITCSATDTETLGTYSITPSGAEAQNYEITYVNGALLIMDMSLPEGLEYVDLGLPSGIKWANMNVGATSVEDAGQVFSWGETTTKEEYSDDNYLWGTSIYDISKYNMNDGLTVLLPEDDAATVNMGAGWRIPTVEEWYELENNCTRQWTKSNGVYGYRFTSTNGNYIFLPILVESSWMNGAGSYWTSTLGDVDYVAYDIDFDGGGFYIDCSHGGHRSAGRNVRAVYERLKCATPTITYTEGKLKFTSETEGVMFVSTVTVGEDITSYEDEVPLTPIYRVSVYAKKDGYEDSEVATKDIDFRALRGDVNDDGEITISDAVRIVNIILGNSNSAASE